MVLPIAMFQKLLEDIEDLAAIAERRDEPTIPHDEFIKELKQDGIIYIRVETIRHKRTQTTP